jgi:hypothetical protein
MDNHRFVLVGPALRAGRGRPAQVGMSLSFLIMMCFAFGMLQGRAESWALANGSCITGRLVEVHPKVVVIQHENGMRQTLARSQLAPSARLQLAKSEDNAEEIAQIQKDLLPAGLNAEAHHLKAQADRLRALHEAGRIDATEYQENRAALRKLFWTRYDALIGTNASPETAGAASNLLSSAGLSPY